MPYTLVHPFFLFPLKSKIKKLPLSAIFIASIAPDFDILFRITDTRIHIFQFTIKEILLLILPLSFVIWLAYEYVLKSIIISVFPFLSNAKEDSKNIIVVLLSMLVSIMLHLFLDVISHWDAFSLSMLVGWNSGNKILAAFFYLYALYGNAILFSAVGFYFLYRYYFGKINWNYKLNMIQKKYLILYSIITLMFFIIKYSFAFSERNFFIDIIIINFTSALIFSFFATPAFYFILQKIKLINAQSNS